MSSREPMWYCHQCRAEMRPLMVPDPVCASCQSSFVEKIEDPADDPRSFMVGPRAGDHGEEDTLDNFFTTIQTLLSRGTQQQQQQQQRSSAETPSRQQSPRVTFQFRSNSGPQRTWTFGGPDTLNTSRSPTGSPNPGAVPTMSEFVRSAPAGPTNGRDGPLISGPLFAQYLMTLLGQTDHPLLPFFMGGVPENGRLGDYVFSQEALDQIITQIMESSNANRPVPATEEIVEKLPREVLEEGSELLAKDCAVCKDQFQLVTEDPDEQIIITLPCNHPFHQPCIVPWLKSSGTCPVCRHSLIPQPDHHPTTPNNASSSHQFRARSQSPPRQSDTLSGSGSGGLFTSLWGNLPGLGVGSNSSANRSSSRPTRSSPSSGSRQHQHQRSTSDPSTSTSPGQRNTSSSASRSRNSNSRSHVPGQWSEDMDLD